MKKFAIVNSYKRNRVVGHLEYTSKTKTFKITIDPDVNASELPLILAAFQKRGIYELDPEWSLRWVQERIVPSNRQNIGSILREHGLSLYDEATIIENTRGICPQDDFELLTEGSISSSDEFSASDIRSIRMICDMTQATFAKIIGVSTKTVEAWESGRVSPSGTAKKLLGLIRKDPDIIYKL